jgi:hypothetical protein
MSLSTAAIIVIYLYIGVHFLPVSVGDKNNPHIFKLFLKNFRPNKILLGLVRIVSILLWPALLVIVTTFFYLKIKRAMREGTFVDVKTFLEEFEKS